MVNFGGSLLRSFPDAHGLARALAKLDVLASVDILPNETTALSTHVLPTLSQLEREDVSLWDMLASRLAMQHTPAVLARRGTRRAAWWVIADLMRRMGLPVADDVPQTDSEGTSQAMLARQFAYARKPFAAVAEGAYVEEPLEFPAKWVDSHIERAGGWDLAPPDLVAELARLGTRSAVLIPGTLQLTPRRQRRRLNAQLGFLGEQPEALIHPVDAVAAGIADGDKVRLETPCGTITCPAKIDLAMRRGAVSVPHGDAHSNVNLLTDAGVADPLTGMVRYGGFAVTVAKAC